MTGAADEPAVDADDLRRRLYRPDANAADLDRYLAVRRVEVIPELTAPRRRSAPRAGVVAVAVALVVGCIGTAALLHEPTTTPKPVAAATHTVSVDIGDGRLLAVDPDELASPARTAVDIGGQPSSAQRYDGRGDQVVTVALPDAPPDPGRAVVVLYSDRPSTISWRALRVATRRDWSSYEQVVATGRVAGRPDSATPDLFGYTGAPPTTLAVEAPPDLHWTLLIASGSDPTTPLH